MFTIIRSLSRSEPNDDDRRCVGTFYMLHVCF